jgi:hypothetical protein
MATATQHLGIPQRHGAGWFVPSASVPDFGYYVELGEMVRCTCPSFVWRSTKLPRGECKHIQRAREEVLMGD